MHLSKRTDTEMEKNNSLRRGQQSRTDKGEEETGVLCTQVVIKYVYI